MIERFAGSRLALAGLFVIAALLGAAMLFAIQQIVPGARMDRAQVEDIVHDYIVSHPEVIPEAIQALQANDTAQTIVANRPEIVTPVGNAWMGNPKGDVTLVEYYDYNCGYCRASLPMLDQLVKRDPKLKIVFKDLPVLSDISGVAARWSIVAAQRGRFKQFHDALFAAGPVSDASLKAAAQAAGLDPASVAEAAKAPAVDQIVQQNLAMARQLGMTGTPTWVLGTRVISGALPIDAMQSAIAKARSTS